jgi:hypothetical protein
MLQCAQVFFIIITIIVLVAGGIAMVKTRHRQSLFLKICLSLIIGGAIGNFIDRVAIGYVRDFLDFSQVYFPWVFNIADMCLVVGAILLGVYVIFFYKPKEKAEKVIMGDHHGHRFNDIDRLRLPERMERLEVERVTHLALEGIPFHSVIDIGTGSGIFAEAFARRGLDVTGIDVNPEMLEAAARYLPVGHFQQGMAESLPYPDGSFELAFMGLVLHETDDLLKALQEAYRVSTVRVVVLEWPYAEQDDGPGLEERLQPDHIKTQGKQAGFERIETIPLKTLILYRMEKGSGNGKV